MHGCLQQTYGTANTSASARRALFCLFRTGGQSNRPRVSGVYSSTRRYNKFSVLSCLSLRATSNRENVQASIKRTETSITVEPPFNSPYHDVYKDVSPPPVATRSKHATHKAVVEEKDAHGVDTRDQNVEPEVELVPFDQQRVRQVPLCD